MKPVRKGRRVQQLAGLSAMVPVPTSEDSIAQSFAEEYVSWFCYVSDWSCWLRWDGTIWKKNAQNAVIESIRNLCRKLARAEHEPRKIERLQSLQKIRAVEQLARSDPRLAVAASYWDVDPWLLNTPDGVTDLRTGQASPHDPAHHLLRRTEASPRGSCPRWLEFLRTITDGDDALAAYLQRVAGYCLAGSVSEQVFFYLWGKGANGKSVFTTVITEIWGSYATLAAPGMLAASYRDRHPTEIAKLRGARLVIASEMEKNAQLAQNKLKLLTGGDRLTARLMHQDYEEFEPHFKLLMVGNGLPKLGDVDEAICRRIQIIPFAVIIPANQRDTKLVETLLAEADGILGWALAGCLAWQKGGLQPPDCVTRLTASHLDAADPVSMFIKNCCDVGPGYSCGSSELHAAWGKWAAVEDALSQKALVQAIMSRGYQARRSTTKRFITGLRLKGTFENIP